MSSYNSNLASILDAAKKIKSGGFEDPNKDKFWLAEVDKVGNGSAIIRFLPSPDPDGVPFVKIYRHGFKGPTGKWFIENCPTTIGEDCPTCKSNGILWHSGIDSNKTIVRERKRKLNFISNIQVISDFANPQNDGGVFMFKYGPRIFDMLITAMQPEFEDIKAVNPFDPIVGANFHLRIRRVDGQANFDKSSFGDPVAIEDIDEVLTRCHDIHSLVSADQFKSYADLEKKLNMVLGGEVTEAVQRAPTTDRGRSAAPAAKPVPKVEDVEEDEDLKYFRSLTEDEDVPF